MGKKKANIDDWEAALIKAMVADGGFTNDQIIAYFSRPDRPVSPFRISEIKKGTHHNHVSVANSEQLNAYVRTYRSPGEARHRFFEENPLHPVNLCALFRVKDGTTNILHIAESDRVECKESLNFANKAQYARVVASFANARGGFLIFGIRDADKAIVGIQPGKLAKYDPAKFGQYLSERFSPVPVWEPTETEIGGKTIGLIYVRPAAHRPVICTKTDGSDLREADVYYRYPGETRRIRYAELVQILSERSRQTERQWADVLNRVEKAGVENVAILDTATGEVSGRSGSFLIEEQLIPKLKFVAEGYFSEVEGDPTLKLIGNVEPLSAGKSHPATIVLEKGLLSDSDLMEDFVNRSNVTNPELYIRHLAHSPKLWLPVFYYTRQTRRSQQEIINFLNTEKGARAKHTAKVIARIKNKNFPPGTPAQKSVETERTAIIDRTLKPPMDEKTCRAFLKAVRTLTAGEVREDYLFPMLKHCFDHFMHESWAPQIQYALAHVDVIWHAQLDAIELSSGASSTRVPYR